MVDNAAVSSDRRRSRQLPQGQLAGEVESTGVRGVRRLALVLALMCGVGILLASFYPFHRIHDPTQLARQWQRFYSPWFVSPQVSLRFRMIHLIENFFFYFPLGVTVALTLPHGSPSRRVTMVQTFALALGLMMSLVIEFLQIGFVDRDPDLTDSVMNTMGYLMGFLLMRWMAWRYGVVLLLSYWFLSLDNRKRAAWVAILVYTTLVLLIAIDPWEPLMEMSRVMGRMGIPSRFLFRSYPSLLGPWTPGRVAGVVLFALLFTPWGIFVRSALHRWNTLRLCVCLLFVYGAAMMMQAGGGDSARILGGMGGALLGGGLAGWLECHVQMRSRSL